MRMVCLGLLLIAQVASAQSLPDAKTLLEREATAFDAVSSYRFEEATTMTMTVSGMPIDVQITTAVTAVNPGKRRMSTKMAGMEMQLLVANGQDVWMLVPMLNQYMHLSGNDSVAAALGGGFLTTLGTGDTAKVVRSESVTVDGTSHDCWVVESRSDRIGVSGMEMRNISATSWIEQSTGVTWRRTMTATMPEGLLPVGGEVKMESIRRGLVFNEPVSDSVFVFAPPPGATEMSLDGIAGLPGLAPGAPAAAPPAVTPRRKSAAPTRPGEPQAYVPMLHPIERIEPVWPAEAKNGIQGSIELVLTIDEQGTVTAAEPLTGPKALRPAAVATATRMQFRPVIRDGRPVAAYTTQTVDFIDWSTFDPRADLDMTDGLASAQRNLTLSQALPRTKPQVLADFENDLDGAEPALRHAFLPQLAKAAVDAGEIDKAERYAYDVLGSIGDCGNGCGVSPEADRTSLDGTAVHDSHLVLGRVAMARQDIDLARLHLLEAGKTSGGPVLDSFGPDLTLARQLLDAGESAAVLEYLARCETFWKTGRPQLQKWEAAIRAGERPYLATPP